MERKLVNAPNCYPILDLSFKGKRWGQKGSVCGSRECGPSKRGWRVGFWGFWRFSGALRTTPGSACRAAPSTRHKWDGSLEDACEGGGCLDHPGSGLAKAAGHSFPSLQRESGDVGRSGCLV